MDGFGDEIEEIAEEVGEEDKPVRIEVTSDLPEHSSGYHYYDEEKRQHVVQVSPHASATTKLHEIAHAKLGHKGSAKNIGEKTHREIDADLWAYEKMGREFGYWGFLDDLDEVIDSTNVRVNPMYTYALKLADEYGWDLDEEQKRELWWHIRDKIAQRQR